MSKLSERLKAFNRNLMPDMVHLKYEAMTDNAFRFYRGTCHLFYEDLSKTDVLPFASDLGLHLENFGSFNYEQFIKDYKKGIFN